jgi:hypothetical protein
VYGLRFEQGSPEYEAGVLATWLQCSVFRVEKISYDKIELPKLVVNRFIGEWWKG